jgi:isopenicillin N synthase-like dioxygenase
MPPTTDAPADGTGHRRVPAGPLGHRYRQDRQDRQDRLRPSRAAPRREPPADRPERPVPGPQARAPGAVLPHDPRMNPSPVKGPDMLKEIDLGRPGGRHHLRGALHDGFFLVRNTVPESLLDEAYAFLHAFFALDPGAKHDCRIPDSNGRSGYTPPPTGRADKDTGPDRKELFHWGTPLPARHPLRIRYPARYPDPYFPDHLVPGIGSALRELHTRLLCFQHDIVRTLADALGAHPDYFTDMLEDGPAVNRATWHPPAEQAASERQTRAAEHQDPGLITTSPRADATGLEVLVDGEWLAVDAPPGYAVVHVGMVLDRLTDGLARAAVHRVVARPGRHEGHLSVVQFCHPAPWTTLTPLRVPGAEDTPQRFATLTADELFQRATHRIERPSPPRPGDPRHPAAPAPAGRVPPARGGRR